MLPVNTHYNAQAAANNPEKIQTTSDKVYKSICKFVFCKFALVRDLVLQSYVASSKLMQCRAQFSMHRAPKKIQRKFYQALKICTRTYDKLLSLIFTRYKLGVLSSMQYHKQTLKARRCSVHTAQKYTNKIKTSSNGILEVQCKFSGAKSA